MSFPLSGLNALYDLNGSNLLALLEMADVSADVSTVDAAGAGDTDEYTLPTKRAAKHHFTVYQLNASSVPCTNLDISVWSVGGTSLLGTVKKGSISVTVRQKDVSGIASFDKVPAFRRRAVQVSTRKMVFSTSLVGSLVSDAAGGLSVQVSIGFGATTFTQQMLMTAGKITVQGEETTIEDVTFKGQQSPTSPLDDSLLGVAFTSAQMSFVLTTAASGGEQFEAVGGTLGLLTQLNVSFADAAIIKAEGTLEVQGPVTYTTT